MASYTAVIERANRKSLDNVKVEITILDQGPGRQSWTGEFMSRSADGILPDERLSLTFDSGQTGKARVNETHFDSRHPDSTRVTFRGTGPLA
ncbi:MAG TPA: hypothetical protein VFU00_07135 [Gemmatimonadales bacterium]|nr:hypothetical protein [Gemmatimonadales bacterium]